MTTMNLNFIKNIDENTTAEFFSAVSYEYHDMSVASLKESISRLEKRIENKNQTLSESKVASLKEELEDTKTTLKKHEEEVATLKATYEKVVSVMSAKNVDHFGNNKDVVRTVLRVLATYEDSSLAKYAIVPAFENQELADALLEIHDVTSKRGEHGEIDNESVKDAYKKASKELERIIKTTFSLPFETEYTTKTRIKIVAEDKALLHESFVRGFKNNFEEENGNVSFKGRTVNTLVKAKKNKKTGKKEYDYAPLASCLCNIVIKHYFA